MAKPTEKNTPPSAPRPRGSLLTLDTVAKLKRETVTIDGTKYALRNLDELSITESRRYELFMQDFQPLMAALVERDLTSQEEDAAREQLLEFLPYVFEAPRHVLEGLASTALVRILSVFMNGPSAVAPTDRNARPVRLSKTGEKSRRASRASTGSRRRTGSRSAKAPS